MKKFYILALLSILFIGKVNAEEIYYTNSNGVNLTKHEYNVLSEFYWDGYQKNMSNEELEFVKNRGLFENEIKTVEIKDNPIALYGVAEHTTSYKSLKLTVSCESDCLVAVSLQWLKLPKIRSYDILGFYLENANVIIDTDVIVDTNFGRTYHSIDKRSSTGIGTSFKIPTAVEYLNISQNLIVEKGGIARASYQHASKTISEANSKKYTFSKTGVGGVFNFGSGIQSYYDCMNGVKLDIR